MPRDEPLHLPKKVVIENALKAIEEGRLQLQHPELSGGHVRCFYKHPRDPNVCCGIGASISPDDSLSGSLSGISTLLAEEWVTTDDGPFLSELQFRHDQLCWDRDRPIEDRVAELKEYLNDHR